MKAIFAVLAIVAISLYTADAVEEVTCPENDTGDYVLISHPCSCTTYFVCLGYEPIPMECPRGLWFSQEGQKCDWKNKVKCTIQPGCSSS
ncbi:peritrophin-1-like [Colletes gigas]|uniref:peritrophin-1-like n=1 Tax=Colletes gigas TaxID=935657 RepID=UPI001C9B96EF|nr:peritrophin-1-like [Colletes gigas]